jgi:hypothetical protein
MNSTVLWLFKFGVCQKINILYVMGKSAMIISIIGQSLHGDYVENTKR